MTKKTTPAEASILQRRDYSQKEREAMDKSDFGDPEHLAFPIKVAEDVIHAAERLHNASGNQAAIKKRIIAIAKRKGFPLPETWQEEMKSERAMKADDADGGEDMDEDGEEDGREGEELVDDATSTSGNQDDNDQEDEMPAARPNKTAKRRSPAAAPQQKEKRSMPPESLQLYLPITRIDQEAREVTLTATAERLDAYRTVIGYEGSKEAFASWRGNIREMHDPHKAVGRALSILPKDENKEIDIVLRVSRGAEDTWQKVLDGTLTGASIGAKNGKWGETVWEGQKVPFLERYDLIEVSLVDNPACPGCDVKIVRADGLVSSVLASESEVETAAVARSSDGEQIERKGARLSQETMDAMHVARDHAMNAYKSSMQTCGCDDCTDMLNQICATDDNDGDMDANFLAQPAARTAIAEIVRGVLSESLRDQFAPMAARVNALLARDARRSEKPAPDIERRVDDLASQLKAIHDLVEKIAAQPVDGGPILHGAPIDKRLATQAGTTRANDADTIRAALDLGFQPPAELKDQLKAAASLIAAGR